MRNLWWIPAFALVVSMPVFAGASLSLDPQLGKISARCRESKGTTHVWLFKQWHLSPSVITNGTNQAKPIPQRANQTAIYRQLEKWIREERVNELYAEGCSGELTERSAIRFNGWSIEQLKAAAGESDYAEIVASVPLKLEAKFGDQLRTICGDDDALLKEHGLAFSDARGALGFLTRLEQYEKDPVRAKTYVEGVIELYKLPPTATIQEAFARVRLALKGSIERVQALLERRNAKLVAEIRKSKTSNVAVVFGGVHATGIVRQLNEAGLGCTVIEPAGYQDDEAALLNRLEALAKSL